MARVQGWPVLDEDTIRRFVFQTFGQARRTLDSPIAPDVWVSLIHRANSVARARHERKKQPEMLIDVLITPWSGAAPGEIASYLSEGNQDRPDVTVRNVALNAGYVVASLDLGAIVVLIIPMTEWWQSMDNAFWGRQTDFYSYEEIKSSSLSEVLRKSSNGAIQYFRFAAIAGFVQALLKANSREALRLAEIARKFAALSCREKVAFRGDGEGTTPDEPTGAELVALIRPMEYAFGGELEGHMPHEHDFQRTTDPERQRGTGERQLRRALTKPHVQAVNENRPAAPMLFDSRLTVKADAAQLLFQIAAKNITFAMIDGGIDATHPAFLDWAAAGLDDAIQKAIDNDAANHPNNRRGASDYGPAEKQERLSRSRVVKTYDFTRLRAIQVAAHKGGADTETCPEIRDIIENPAFSDNIDHLRTRFNHARDLDWTIVEPLIEVRHANAAAYSVPCNGHGTHVAGILAADLKTPEDINAPLSGMCPDMRLYDLRVFDDNGNSDEFTILCAVEFVAWLNRNREFPVVHGVNMSLALRHYVDSYACGRTPICEACNRLVGSGTVVVVAAGNTGFDEMAQKQSLGSGYMSVTITDPGNADAVITVGSTHRRDPHAYGVSYFSSRGPTGDGRRKPDLVAPGEKITSTVPYGKTERMDGTSMAAPHVSGAAAMLMARYPELIGQPARVKEILMRTATDLSRDRDFQGAGLVDVLRALQSV